MTGSSKDSEFDFLKRPLSRRDLLKGTAIAGASFALAPAIAACGGGGGGGGTASPTTGGGPKKGGDLKVGIVGGSAKDTLNGLAATTEPDICIQTQLYDSLMGWDQDYQLVYHLAEEVSGNEDASVWTIRLKPDLTWHDGKPVTADDVVYTFQLITDPNNPLAGAASLGGLVPKNIVKVDDKTVEFRLDKPNAILPEGLAYRTNILVPVDFDPAKPVGCGPFKLDVFKPGEQISFLPFDGYWGEGPYVSSLTVIEFAEEAARVNAFLSDAVDAMSQLPRAQVNVVSGSAGHKVLRAQTGAWQPFTMRIDVKPLSDVRVRQAMRLIVDRQQMLEQAYTGYGWVGNDMYAPFDPGYPKDLPQREQDLEQAKSLLKQAGYSDLSIELVTSDAVGGSAVAAAQVFAEQAKGAGVAVNVKKVDAGVFYGEDYLTWTFAQDFWYTRNYLAQAAAGSLPTAPYNECHWKNAKWQALVEEAYQTVDETKRNELIAEAEKIEYDEGGYIIWAFNDQIDAYNEKLGGVKPDKQGTPLSGFRFHMWYFA
jgi:peptide/nickel transport system substrate-binding protein